MCGSSSYLHHNRTGKEIEFKSKSRHHDIPCNKVVPNNAIWQQNSDINRELNTVETMWLTKYPRPIEITYDQGSEFIGHEFIKYLVEA